MTYTIELDAQTEQTLEERARQRGVSVQILLGEIVESYTNAEQKRRGVVARGYGMLPSDGHDVDRFLADRHEEAELEIQQAKERDKRVSP